MGHIVQILGDADSNREVAKGVGTYDLGEWSMEREAGLISVIVQIAIDPEAHMTFPITSPVPLPQADQGTLSPAWDRYLSPLYSDNFNICAYN